MYETRTIGSYGPQCIWPICRRSSIVSFWYNSVRSLACRHRPQGLGYTLYRRRNRRAAPMVERVLMTEPPLHWLTISELSQRIRQGALSPVELTEHLLSRLEALDGLDHDVSRLAQRKRSARHRDTDTERRRKCSAMAKTAEESCPPLTSQATGRCERDVRRTQSSNSAR